MSRYSPKQYATALYESLAEAKGSNHDAVIRAFAGIVAANYDRALLPKIVMQLKKLERTRAGRHDVVVTSARPLTKAILEEVKGKVGSNSSVTEVIDPSVLGGLKVLINDEVVIDGTFKARIARLVEAVVRASN
jgi:F0F1-type ATP synthase delta subunit